LLSFIVCVRELMMIGHLLCCFLFTQL
jgi:hypothetical protein